MDEWYSVRYTVNGSSYYADINITDLQDILEEDDVQTAREYIEDMIQEEFNNNIYPSYDLDKIADQINKKYNLDI